MAKLHLKRGDTVKVLTGKDKGADGKVLSVNPSAGFCTVEGVNLVQRHTKARKQGEQSAKVTKEGNIHISNLMVICPSCQKPTRVARQEIDNKHARICKKCGVNLDVKPEKKKAEKKEKKSIKKEAAPVEKTETVAETVEKTENTQNSAE